MIKNKFLKIGNEELWLLHANVEQELKNRGLVRTRNMVGERGEFIVIEFFNKTKGLPNLQAAPQGTQNVDAISKKGERYSIKTITFPNTTTGVFHDFGEKDDIKLPDKKFEYVIIVQLNKDYTPNKIIELSWDLFLKYKKWHKRMRAWNLSITQNLLKDASIIFEKK